MRLLLIAGHGNGDPGAIGNGYREADLTREVVRRLKPLIPCTVDIADTSQNWFEWLGSHSYNFTAYDYVLEVHFNSGGGHGTEIYVTTSERNTTVEANIVNSLAVAGLTNRGIKRKNFRVINRIKSQGVSSALLEVCFIDSASDMTVWQQKSDALIQAIADGIKRGFGLKGDDEPMTTEERTKFNECVRAISDLTERVDDLTARVDAHTKPEMVYNYIDKNIPPWAVDAVKWAKDSGIIEGDEHGLLNLTDLKLWVLIVLHRTAKWIGKQMNIKI